MTFSTKRVALPDCVANDLSRALTTPAVTDPENPNGFPIATTS
jgi:hypothetical protein